MLKAPGAEPCQNACGGVNEQKKFCSHLLIHIYIRLRLGLHTTGFAGVVFQVCTKAIILFYLFDIV